ncbi:MAG: C25 family cysteine peptidase, partial [Candidatus Edwardsbacteria bacterium]|nr:C25 family cysteine peptidase [Candidatus Edwardsbacteria bacterium]
SSQDTKPGARADLIRYWNEGAGVVNFFGHGAWWIWGHESYFRDTDVPNLSNGDRLPLVVMFSCGTSRFDNPHSESIGSALVTSGNGGAIATIGAMRESGGNFNLAAKIYGHLFSSAGGDIGQAFYTAKYKTNNPDNNASYVLLGDPGISLGQPQGQISLTLNSDTLLSQGRYVVSGRVSGLPSLFQGQVQVSVFDFARRDSSNTYPNLKFIRPGKLIFKGLAQVTRDSFQTVFNVSSMLPPPHNGVLIFAGARISAYAWNGSADAAGATTDTIWIGGRDTTRPDDHRGPSVSVYANGLPVAGGDTIDPAARVMVRISDPLGINIAPGVPEGEIRIRFDREDYSDLSQQFLYESGSDSSGTAGINKTFTSGRHTIKVEVYDCMLNKTTWERSVTVADMQLRVESVFNYPNPFKDQTCFTFQIRQAADVTIRVFTVAGRLIRTIDAPALSAGYNQVRWDGRDARYRYELAMCRYRMGDLAGAAADFTRGLALGGATPEMRYFCVLAHLRQGDSA